VGEVIATHAVAFSEVADDGLDGGPPFAFADDALDLWRVQGVAPWDRAGGAPAPARAGPGIASKSLFATMRRSMSRMARSSTRNKLSKRPESMPSVCLLQIQDTITLSPLPPPCPSLPLLFEAVSAIGSLRNTGVRHAFFGASVPDCATRTSR
jgi:hypothetical protein